VEKRIFAMLHADPDVLILKLDRDDQLNFLEARPDVVTPGAHYSHHGWTRVWYDKVDSDLMQTLIRLAWAHVAPRRLTRKFTH
jgi:hypothetical protein